MAGGLLHQEFDGVVFGSAWQARPEPEYAASGIADIRLPRGCLTEIVGPVSSGRTTLLNAILAAATARQEECALVDADDAFDPLSAAAAGVRLDRLIWIRSARDAEACLKATDLLVQGGGFGVVALDLGDAPAATAGHISLTSWFRLRRAVEHTPTVLISLVRQSHAKTCASLVVECRRERAEWSGRKPARLFRGIRVRATTIERSKACSPVFTARAI